jgi:hypothetical protein
VRVWQLLQQLDRAAADVPIIRIEVNRRVTPSKEWQLATRLSLEPSASALEDLGRQFGELEQGPEPFTSLAARVHVAVCALLFGAPAAACWPRPDRLAGRDSAEVAAMIYVFQGRHGLASQIMDARPRWFTPLDAERDLLDVPDSVLQVDTGWVGIGWEGTTALTRRWIPVPGPSAAVELPADAFWRLAWPLYLRPHNERLVVHRGRLLLADVVRRLAVNGEPLFAPVGDPVRIVRTGVPVAVATLRVGTMPARSDVSLLPWTHETAPGPEALSLPWAPIDLALAATDGRRYGLPRTGFVSEDYRMLGGVAHQLVHYVRAGRRHVEVHTEWTPPGVFDFCTRPRPLLGLIRLDSALQEEHRDVRIDLLDHPRARFDAILEAGTYLYSLELLDHGCHRAGRSRYWIKVPPAEGAFVSDLMLADSLFSADTSRVILRVAGDPMAAMSTSSGVRAGAPVRLYWEVYGVSTAVADANRLAVTFAVVDTKRQRVPVTELPALADRTRRTRGTLELAYNLSVPPGEEPLGCGIAFAMPPDARGLYVARVTVRDTRTGNAAAAERAFVVRR